MRCLPFLASRSDLGLLALWGAVILGRVDNRTAYHSWL